MKEKLLTDAELRANWPLRREKTYRVPEGTMVTPSARDYLRENGIALCAGPAAGEFEAMPVTPMPAVHGKKRFVVLDTGAELEEKPEELTHLRGNLLVPKSHPRIAFRGKLDSLMAQTLQVQLTAGEEGCPAVARELEAFLLYMRRLLAAEVKEEPVEAPRLLELTGGELRDASHHIKRDLGIDHPTPNYRMGRLCVALNCLRTQTREAELAAVAAFTQDGRCTRADIVGGLNRLSSGVYLLFCRYLTGWYGRRE